MNRTDLVRHVADEAGMTRAAAAAAVSAMLSGIAGSLGRGEAVSLPGFGTFASRARAGHNPRTGESVEIAASTMPAFKPGKPLRDLVNGAGA